TVGVTPTCLIFGGGVGGMTAELSLADQGFSVDIVEMEKELGGLAKNLLRTPDGSDVQAFIASRIAEVQKHKRITVHTGNELAKTEGFVGNFKTTLTDGTAIDHGAIILATGGVEYEPSEYLYKESEQVITQWELEKKLAAANALKSGERFVMIQCVGSREEPAQ